MEIPGGVLLSVFTALLCRQVVPLYSWLINGQPAKSEPRRLDSENLSKEPGRAAHKNVSLLSETATAGRYSSL